MVTVKSDLEIIKVFWEGQTYQIKAEKIKYTDKQDIESTHACDSHDPNTITFGKCTYSIDLSGVQSHRWLFIWMRERQRTGNFKNYPQISTYKYEAGKVVNDCRFTGCFVEEMSGENNEPFDVKMVAMSRVYRDSQNRVM